MHLSPIDTYLTGLQQLCPSLTETQLAQIGAGLKVLTFPPKAFFLEMGEIPHAIGIIQTGLFKTFYHTTDGEWVNINFSQEGQALGDYLAFSQQQPSKYSFQALEYSTVIAFPYAHWQHCLQTIPTLERYVRLTLEKVFANYLARTESFLISNAEARYLHFVEQNPALFKRISLTDLCSYLGITRQSLTRIRKNLLSHKN